MTARPEQRQTALALVAEGAPITHAAALVGVTHTTVARWVRKGGDVVAEEFGTLAEYWPTPPGLALLTTLAALRLLRPAAQLGGDCPPLRVLCPCAGSGVYVRAVQALAPGADVVAIEPRRSAVESLVKFCPEVIHAAIRGHGAKEIAQSEGCEIVDFDDLQRLGPFDLVIDNPPFTWLTGSQAGGRKDGGRHLSFRPLLRRGGLLAFLGPSTYGHAESHQEAMRAWTPTAQLRITGRPRFAGDEGGTADISMWVWSATRGSVDGRGVARGWTCRQLATDPAWLRWSSTVPGVEPLDPMLVAQVVATS